MSSGRGLDRGPRKDGRRRSLVSACTNRRNARPKSRISASSAAARRRSTVARNARTCSGVPVLCRRRHTLSADSSTISPRDGHRVPSMRWIPSKGIHPGPAPVRHSAMSGSSSSTAARSAARATDRTRCPLSRFAKWPVDTPICRAATGRDHPRASRAAWMAAASSAGSSRCWDGRCPELHYGGRQVHSPTPRIGLSAHRSTANMSPDTSRPPDVWRAGERDRCARALVADLAGGARLHPRHPGNVISPSRSTCHMVRLPPRGGVGRRERGPRHGRRRRDRAARRDLAGHPRPGRAAAHRG
jgi:hypothetical protein